MQEKGRKITMRPRKTELLSREKETRRTKQAGGALGLVFCGRLVVVDVVAPKTSIVEQESRKENWRFKKG